MNYIYDVVLNFNKNYYDFYEWREDDILLHFKKIPIIKISSENLLLFFNNKISINKEIIKMIINKSETYNYTKNNNLYYCIFSDSKNSIACEFNENGELLNVSSMLLDEENEANDLIKKLPFTDLNINYLKENKKINFKTREEKIKERYIKKQLKYILNNHKYEVLDYIYYEFTGHDKKNKNIKDFLNNPNDINKLYALLKIISLNNSINT